MTHEPPLEWSIDPTQGNIQGPLDLEFLRDRQMSLTLTDDQITLVIENDQLGRVYLAGVHQLDIGPDGHQIDPASSLLFLDLATPLQLSWSRQHPLRCGPASHQRIIGSCHLSIERPGRFFYTFLQGEQHPDTVFIARLAEQIVRGFLETLLADEDPGETQTHLTRLTPDDFDDELGACGLCCSKLAVYTLTPPIESALEAEPELVR